MENNVQLARTEAKKSPQQQFLREENLPKRIENGNQRDPNADPSLKPVPKPIKEDGGEPTRRGGRPRRDPAAQGTIGEVGKDPQLDRALELLKSWQVFKTLVAKND